jgi:hypothetical protein
MKRVIAAMTAALMMVALVSSTAFAAPVKTSVIYNSLVASTPGNSPSVAFAANQINEYGNAVTFAGTKRNLSSVVVTMSSFGCEDGHWWGGCVTTPGATFTEPITLNIYTASSGVNPGALIASVTQTFTIPYRPTANPTKCPSTADIPDGWYGGSPKKCYNGLTTNITFDFSALRQTLPNSVIFGIAYNTSDYGYVPWGDSTACYVTAAGCGYDALNVAVSTADSVGSTGSTWLNSWVPNQLPEVGTWSNPADAPYRVAAQFNATN